MYMDIPLCLALVFVAGGLWLLTWGANRFVDGSAAVAKALGVSPFVIGMVVIGFGQKAAGEGYAAEVPLCADYTVDGIRFTLEGRADGIFTNETVSTFSIFK